MSAPADNLTKSFSRLMKVVASTSEGVIISVVESVEADYVRDGWVDDLSVVFESLRDRLKNGRIQQELDKIISRFVRQVSSSNLRQQGRRFGVNSFAEADVADLLEISAHETSRLIKSIPERYFDDVQTLVIENIRAGNRASQIAPLIKERYNVSYKKAQFIARDQTAKLNGELTKFRQEAAGFEYFKWVTSRDTNVRDLHHEIATKDVGYGVGVYRWDDPPKNKDGEPIVPGTDINCRCTASPVRTKTVERGN